MLFAYAIIRFSHDFAQLQNEVTCYMIRGSMRRGDSMTQFVIVIEDHMLDWRLCQICYPLEIKLLLLLLFDILSNNSSSSYTMFSWDVFYKCIPEISANKMDRDFIRCCRRSSDWSWDWNKATWDDVQSARPVTLDWYFWSYGPLKLKIVDFAIWSCPLCNWKTVQDTLMKLHTNIYQH